MFKSKVFIFTVIIIQMLLLTNSCMSEEQQYSAEMVSNCMKLSEGIDTSDWIIDQDLAVLDDSHLDSLDDGWNKKINQAHEHRLETCSVNQKSDECLLAKSPERKLKKARRSCYYALLMRAI